MCLQGGDQLRFEPGVTFEPVIIAPRRMRQREDIRRMCPPISHGICHIFRAQVPPLRGTANEQGARHVGELFQNLRAPCLRTDWRRRQIRALGIVARKAERHRHDRNTSQIVERGLIDPHPVPQPVARRVCEGLARRVHAGPRRLPCDEQACAGSKPRHWTRLMRGMRGGKTRLTCPARMDIFQQFHGLKVAPQANRDKGACSISIFLAY